MTERAPSPIYLLPGWLNSDPDHWQSRWEALHGDQRIEQNDWEWPRRGDWMARLDEVLLNDVRLGETPALLVAHSLGCQLVAAWAEHSRHSARVAGALLVAPPDTEHPDTPPQLHNWRPIRRARLPFPAVAVVSSDDPFCATERAVQMAADWGAELVMIGARGHINSASGLGDWPEGRALLEGLARR
ncbi:alpha/beta hydrolase [Pelomonas sp. CA6]|uniref:RBBP9/YdeN family alpha/beta hydrolase n=1 Tax=Pelomonas sp. CA6 TaxID=2907999 RepID=UPI001F4BBE3B|nr:alpha/beta hydrolase [Pelomonas sp. CA6]MCH7342825.1 alpha/beta hydrolase [Pelomonas sp. CA6]